MKTKAIVLVSMSSVGKDTLYNKLIEMDIGLRSCISHTTRPKRENERQSISYNFIDKHEFRAMILNKEFIEVRKYAVNGDTWHYGLSKKALNEGEINLIILDLEGLKQLESYLLKENVYSIYLKADNSTRLIRSINRQKEQINNSNDTHIIDEILRRYKADIEDMESAEEYCNFTMVNETYEDLEENIREIINLTTYLKEKGNE